MDTDGTICRKRGLVEFNSTSGWLAEGVVALVRSLGGVATITKRTPHYDYKGEHLAGKPNYRVHFRMALNPFRLARKAIRFRPQTKYLYRRLEAVEPVLNEACTCIRVAAPDGLYVTEDYIVTHNTPQCLVAYAVLREKIPDLKLIVACPKSAQFQWAASVQKFLRDIRPVVVGYSASLTYGGQDARRRAWRSDGDIFITTYHSLARDIDTIVETFDGPVVCFDEVQSLRSYRQKMLRPNARKLSQISRYTWGLTATPLFDRLEDLYGTFDAVKPWVLGKFTDFTEQYVIREWTKLWKPKGRVQGYWKTLGYKNLPQLMQRLQPYYLKRPAAEINQFLPTVRTQTLTVELDAPQRIFYNATIEENFPPRDVDDTKDYRLASLTYAQQAADMPSVLGVDSVGSAKLEELVRFLQDDVVDEKIIVYTRYERVLSAISEELTTRAITAVRISGKEDAGAREKARLAFLNPQSGCNVMLITSAGGQALDLQAASIVLFYDLPWSWGEFQQVLGRARRTGSLHESILCVFLQAEGTIDEHVSAIVTAKERLVDDTFGLAEAAVLTRGEVTLGDLYNAVMSGKHAHV
jgi:SNF2 family DNA or RNA helicase